MSHEKHLEQMADTTLKTWKKMLKDAIKSGALSDDMKSEDNYLLAKAIVDIWCQGRAYRALNSVTQREVDNLSHFI